MTLNKIATKFLAFYVLIVAPALAQGFAGLNSDADGFALPQRSTGLAFRRTMAHTPISASSGGMSRPTCGAPTVNPTVCNGPCFVPPSSLEKQRAGKARNCGWATPR